jgi:NADH-quinone oxidoreductase subunit C
MAKPKEIYTIISRLKDEFGFNMLSDLTCVDYIKENLRFEVNYNLYDLSRHKRIIIKTRLTEENAVIKSLTSLYKAANWFEREVFDMFGVQFEGHPNLKRILLYPEFKGHPLRKDYDYMLRQPLIGPTDTMHAVGMDGGESLEQFKKRLVIKRDIS